MKNLSRYSIFSSFGELCGRYCCPKILFLKLAKCHNWIILKPIWWSCQLVRTKMPLALTRLSFYRPISWSTQTYCVYVPGSWWGLIWSSCASRDGWRSPTKINQREEEQALPHREGKIYAAGESSRVWSRACFSTPMRKEDRIQGGKADDGTVYPGVEAKLDRWELNGVINRWFDG